MDLKHSIMTACHGHKYDVIIETLKQLVPHYEACKKLNDLGRIDNNEKL